MCYKFFRILFSARPIFPQDFLEEPSSPRPADFFQVYSDGDAVPRLPIPRKKLSTSLRSSLQELNVKLKKGRVPYAFPVTRKKWKKIAPNSQPDPASSKSKVFSKKAPDLHEQPTVDLYEEESGDDSLVEYESVWRSSTSDDEADIDYENQLALEAAYMPMVYNDFSLAPPLKT